LAAGFCPQNLAFARKMTALPESGGLQPPAPGSYAYALDFYSSTTHQNHSGARWISMDSHRCRNSSDDLPDMFLRSDICCYSDSAALQYINAITYGLWSGQKPTGQKPI